MTNRELQLEREVARGDKGPAVRRVQEWLNLRGYGLSTLSRGCKNKDFILI